MDHFIENNREIHICTNCKGYYRSNSYEESSGSKFDDTTILQIDGGIITGLLVFLTLTSLIPIVSGPFGNITAIIITAGVIFPFAISAIMILSKHIKMSGRLRVIRIDKLTDKLIKYSGYAGNATFWGFVYLMGAIVVLFIFNLLPLLSPTSTSITEVCEKNSTLFNIEKESCSRIKPGGLYEECVKNAMPNVTGCSEFMID
jgi:hypothetical protein